ncbi:MAG: low molecular weight phosphatase family protein [Gaiellaceae bacterium]
MKHVLFVCNHNAGRSQMAEAFFNHYAPDDVVAQSGGNDPAEEIWPEVVAVMAERGFDLAGQRPKKVTVEMQLHADWAVAVGCEDTCPFVPTTLEEWDIPDPAGRSLAEAREICDLVERQVQTLLTTRLGAIRGDRTHHEQWLRQLLPQLTREFEGAHDPKAIRATADDILWRYEEVPVRSFVVTLAHREARERLRERTPALTG